MADLFTGPVELVFSTLADHSQPVNLVFGAGDDAAVPDVDFTIEGAFPAVPFAGQLQIATVAFFEVAGAFPAPEWNGAIGMIYISGADRSTAAEAALPYQTARQAAGGAETRHRHTASLAGFAAPNWQHTAPLAGQSIPAHQTVLSIARLASAAYQWADALAAQTGSYHQVAIRLDRQRATGWQPANQLTARTSTQHQVARRHAFAAPSTGWKSAVAMSVFLAHNSALARSLDLPYGVPYQQAQVPPAGAWTRPPVTDIRCYMPPIGAVPLVFHSAWSADTNLVFICERHVIEPGAPIFIAVKRVYMTTHSLSARRLPSMEPVPIEEVTLSADVGGFGWQLSASGPISLFEQLAPFAGATAAVPQLIEVTLDGMSWVFAVGSLKKTTAFGKNGASITGFSPTALIGSPWARAIAHNGLFEMSAQQLALQALDLSGVALDWGIADWLVPAGAWSHSGTALSAVQAIAEASGGYLQSHRTEATLQVRHPYPPRPDGSTGGPWNWGTGAADVELAAAAVITSAMERKDGPDIDGVYVSGTAQGVLAHVKRTGTAGAKLAAMQTGALITDDLVARQRGLAILGKAGPQLAVNLDLPVLTGTSEPGVIDVGTLLQVNESTPWRGRVRGVSVRAKMPSARQTLTVERHL